MSLNEGFDRKIDRMKSWTSLSTESVKGVKGSCILGRWRGLCGGLSRRILEAANSLERYEYPSRHCISGNPQRRTP